MSDLDEHYRSLQMDLPPLHYDGRGKPPHLEILIEYFCKIMAINSEKVYEQALDASMDEVNPLLKGLNKKDLTLLRYCVENYIKVIRNKELAELFGVSTRSISKWVADWIDRGVIIPCGGNERITRCMPHPRSKDITEKDLGYTN